MKKGIKMYLDNRQESFVHLFDLVMQLPSLSFTEKCIWLHLAQNADTHHPSQKGVMTKLNIPRPGTLPKAYVKLENLGMITRQTINGRGKQEITVMPPDKWPTTTKTVAMTTTKTVAVENNDHYQNGSATTTKTVAVTTTKTVAPTVLDTVLINRSSNACEETSLAPPPTTTKKIAKKTKKTKSRKQKTKQALSEAEILKLIDESPYSGVYTPLMESKLFTSKFDVSKHDLQIQKFLERNGEKYGVTLNHLIAGADELADNNFQYKKTKYTDILTTALKWGKKRATNSSGTQFNAPTQPHRNLNTAEL